MNGIWTTGTAAWRARAAGLGLLVTVLCAIGCQQGEGGARAALAERRASWARELDGIKTEHAALASRFDGRVGAGAGPSGSPWERRARATLDGARQSIADIEAQLQQAEARMDQAIRRGGRQAEESVEAESARVRGYLEALSEQVGRAGREMEVFARADRANNETKQATP